jgi:hypothetical protein
VAARPLDGGVVALRLVRAWDDGGLAGPAAAAGDASSTHLWLSSDGHGGAAT